MEINFIKILHFLKEYSNKEYSKPEKIEDLNRKEEVIRLREIANNMLVEWKKLYDYFEAKGYICNKKSASTWLDGSNTKVRNYLWIEFKRKGKEQYNSSISVFAELVNTMLVFRISIEFRDNDGDKLKREQHNRFLDSIDINSDVRYFGSKEKEVGYEEISKNEVVTFIKKVKTGEYNKLQIGYTINEKEIKDKGWKWTLEQLDIYFTNLEKYYKECVENSKEELESEAIINDFIELDSMDWLNDIKSYINSKGFIYNSEELSNLYLSLKTKPFVILAGISGTGKSKLVKLFGEAIGATASNGRYNMISVKPDWNDSTELLGYKNLNDEFIKGRLTEIIIEASKEENRNKPYFICLDEMNLARVEYYLSEYLSIVESREFDDNGDIVTDKIFTNSDNIDDHMKELILPDNLYIIGTVNMDDTTFAFSRKVLDRANTIEFSDVHLDNLDFLECNAEQLDLDNRFLKSNFINIKDALNSNRDYVTEVNSKIIQVNEILKKSGKQFGYRVRDEIVFYMLENKINNLLDEDIAFDYQIMQKVLPTITGSEVTIKETLIALYNYCNSKGINGSDYDYLTKAQENLSDARYLKSAKKIIMMLRGYEDGFTSFWL